MPGKIKAMEFQVRALRLNKLHPLTISRGVSTGSDNLFVFIKDGDHVGVGECAPGTGDDDALAQRARAQFEQVFALDLSDWSPYLVDLTMRRMGLEAPVRAAIDMALWDLTAKRAGLPLHQVLGHPKPIKATSLTVGINTPERTAELTAEIFGELRGKALKLKLGSPRGIRADKASYEAAMEALKPFKAAIRVDANGGWSVEDALEMMPWLAERGCEYVEQPLARGEEDQLPELFRKRPLPIFLDESVRDAADVPALADRCDGVNLKLMKTGGITEAMRLVAVARAHGLQTMIGCMGESSVSIAAGASIGALFDHIDLDSHLNLNPDPAEGLKYVAGVVLPSDRPGHGATVVE
jgi:L-alanine-DL-glutamate epimerase-like enolase superfamily enzyme